MAFLVGSCFLRLQLIMLTHKYTQLWAPRGHPDFLRAGFWQPVRTYAP
uniref:Uncharacterized protein n=1 Tax=Arundo donax TaxID=35708 RepID=A0A0A9G3N6_ARUDO